MAHTPSWNWLPTRFTRFRPAPTDRKAKRPCLPMLEQMEDRILLSAATDTLLIGLLSKQVELRNGEVSLMKLAGGLIGTDKIMGDAFLKIERELMKVDNAVFKITEDALVGQKVSNDEMQKIDEAFVKIETEAKLFGENGAGELLPAVQRVQQAALNALAPLANLPRGGVLSDKAAAPFVNVEDQFLKVDHIMMKWDRGVVDDKWTQDKQDAALVKLDDAFQKIDVDLAVMGDGSVRFNQIMGEVDALKVDTTDFLTSFANPITAPT